MAKKKGGFGRFLGAITGTPYERLLKQVDKLVDQYDDDEELAAGFMTTEGFTHSKSDFKEIDRCRMASHPENTIRVRMSTGVKLNKIESLR